ncbi:MAG: ATP-binding protein, partial [Ignavibacteria bacterium]|nr:ATP-binding protein [Ignavibacteria bacterium]
RANSRKIVTCHNRKALSLFFLCMILLVFSCPKFNTFSLFGSGLSRLGFARQKSKETESIDLNELIYKVTQLLDYKIRQKNISFTFLPFEKLPTIKADPVLLQEVILNLLINSFDAVSVNGIISITTFQKANQIGISIKDNGIGISAEDLNSIFDPFFTTKEAGEGTGLGLSVSLGIIETHGGEIKVKSVPGVETEFTVYLPLEESK